MADKKPALVLDADQLAALIKERDDELLKGRPERAALCDEQLKLAGYRGKSPAKRAETRPRGDVEER